MLDPGTRVGPYVIEALLGMGGMGAVYRARDPRLGRAVALKVVRPDRADESGVTPEDRLLGEARAAAALHHAHIVQVYDAGKIDGQTYVAMELVDGAPLRAQVGDPTVPLAVRRRWLVEVAQALGAAHRAGLVHRDIKPENVIIDRDRAAKVLDFGLAKRLAFDPSAPTADEPAPETLAGRVLGTVSYMAPEQLAGGPADSKWDQFAWAVTAYELLTGVHPRTTVPMPGRTAHLTQTPKMAHEVAPELGFSEAAAVMLAMSPDPARRFASMDEAIAAFTEPASPESPERRAPEPVASARRAPEPARQAPPASSSRRRPALVAAVALGAACAGGALVYAGTRRAPVVVAPARPLAPPSTEPRAPAARAASPAAPVACAAAVERQPEPMPASSASSGRRADVLTNCMCVGSYGLCPFGSDPSKRQCPCKGADGSYLANKHGGTSSRWAPVAGKGLADGQPCQGFDDRGAPKQGVLSGCMLDCDHQGFSGLHRARCRGLDEHGRPADGVLLCY